MNLQSGVPPAITLNFIPQRKPPGVVGWLILLAGVLASLAVLQEYFDLNEAAADAETRLAREERVINHKLGRELARTHEKIPDAELLHAAQLAREMRRPWLIMLDEIELAGDADIALLAVEPLSGKAGSNTTAGSIKLTGEARSLEALFAYSRRLGAQPSLAGAQVDSYEFKKSGAADVVVFKLSARWKAES